ncbi:hypothetical protein SBDP1_920010 [Syntrophobacter sp. SbD1]|nr:hypothetical protein SBDP1_920010 [Syntrophobacter sp. SbD1]
MRVAGGRAEQNLRAELKRDLFVNNHAPKILSILDALVAVILSK